MPLTKSGKKVMAAMMKQYGEKKGKQVFYASENKKVAGSNKWVKKSSGKSYTREHIKLARRMIK